MSIITDFHPEFINNSPLGISIYSVNREPSHYHKNILELIYCIRGSISVVWSYDTDTLSKGQILCINCNEVHGISSSDEDNLVISFYLDLSHPIFSGKNLENFMLRIAPDYETTDRRAHLKELNDFLLSILYIYTGSYETSESAFNKISIKLTDFIFKHFGVFYINDDYTDLPWSKERFEHILLYINTHYKEKLTLKSLSAKEHLNANYLSIYFNRIFDDTFYNYLAVIRIYHSELELLTTDSTISAISYDYGFSDPRFYYKAFKKWYGTTPAKHRQRHAKRNKESIPNRIYRVNEIRHVVQQYILYYFSKLQLETFDIHIPDIRLSSSKSKNYSEWRSF